MVDLDLADILSAHLPRTVQSITAKKIELMANTKNSWLLYFSDPNVTLQSTKKVLEFCLFVELGMTKDESKQAVNVKGAWDTAVPLRAKEWIEDKLKEIDEAHCSMGLRDRLVPHECNGRFRVISTVGLVMPCEAAVLLSAKSPAYFNEFLQKFDEALYQVAVDFFQILKFDQEYKFRVHSLNS